MIARRLMSLMRLDECECAVTASAAHMITTRVAGAGAVQVADTEELSQDVCAGQPGNYCQDLASKRCSYGSSLHIFQVQVQGREWVAERCHAQLAERADGCGLLVSPQH